MNTTKGFFYGLLAICGVLTPWVWATGFVALLLDYIVKYLAGGREIEINKLIKIKILPLELEIERLKNEINELKG
jgi:hypothetical protein